MTSPRRRLQRRSCFLVLAALGFLFFVGGAHGDEDPPAPAGPEAAPATPEEAQRWLGEHLPKWRATLTGPTSSPECDPGNPLSLDAWCQLAVQRENEHGADFGEPILLSAWRLRDQGSARKEDDAGPKAVHVANRASVALLADARSLHAAHRPRLPGPAEQRAVAFDARLAGRAAIAACVGVGGGFAILCHPLLRWFFVPTLLIAVALRSAALFGAGTPTQILVAAPLLAYVLWQSHKMRRKSASP